MVKHNWRAFLSGPALCAAALNGATAFGAVEQRVFCDQNSHQVIKLEWLSDGVLHFEFTRGLARLTNDPIYLSPMIKPQTFAGPTSFLAEGQVFSTKELKVSYNQGCFDAADLATNRLIVHVCAIQTENPWKYLDVTTSGVRNVYGLGQLFDEPGKFSGDRNGKVISTKGGYGNSMPSYAGGATGEVLFPVVMALGSGTNAWSMVLDNQYKQTWDLSQPKWHIGMFGDQLRGFIITGANPKEVRQRFMDLSGHAPVPPRKMFGYWMSEYGYDNWGEVRGRLNGMRQDGFPMDGFFLDLQWFGNVATGSDHTRMGTLEFDDRNFPAAGDTIHSFLKDDDIGLITIEESYIGRALAEHDDMESRGYLAHECGHPTSASYLTGAVTGNLSEWWGRGGMIDWSNADAGKYWHATKRRNLVQMGIFAHWLDLGEPEMFDPRSCYSGSGEPGKNAHQDINNLFSLFWAKSVWDGYESDHVNHRPFSMLRSGNIGMQRFGAGLWSGDISGNLPSLAAHINSHDHIIWSGIDYYSSDIGGFHRNRADGRPLSFDETQENYTQWFANASWFDVPFRSHVMNLDNDRDTAPNRIGHVESNRANILTRYSMIPYYYSLAHQASRTGSPLMEPLAMRFPEDLNVRTASDSLLLGDLLIDSAAASSIYQRSIYLPAGLWYDFFGTDFKKSTGEILSGFPLYRDGLFRVPVFAKGGAIVPRFAGSMNSRGLGRSNTNTLSKAMLLDIYVSDEDSLHTFDLVEDDGDSRDLDRAAVRRTTIGQVTQNFRTKVQIGAAEGTYDGANELRAWTVRIWSPGWDVSGLQLQTQSITNCSSLPSQGLTACYKRLSPSSIIVEFPARSVTSAQEISVQWTPRQARTAEVHFVCDLGRDAPRSQGLYIVGDDPALGSWNPDQAIPLHAAEYARGIWTAVVKNISTARPLSWKCLKKTPGNGDRGIDWQSGDNQIFQVGSQGGFSGMATSVW
jgi:alpha-glucosidase (family GH31 glycosyl hydrolase)